MSIEYIRTRDREENRIEFWLYDYDYINGSDLMAKLFHKEFGMTVGEKFDGIWYSILKLHEDEKEYNLVWHEDFGNFLYCLPQTEEVIDELEERLIVIIKQLNEMIKD